MLESPAAQLVAEALALGIQDDAAHAAEGLHGGSGASSESRGCGVSVWEQSDRTCRSEASAARNLILASASSGLTRPVGWTCTHSRSMVFAPIS